MATAIWLPPTTSHRKLWQRQAFLWIVLTALNSLNVEVPLCPAWGPPPHSLQTFQYLQGLIKGFALCSTYCHWALTSPKSASTLPDKWGSVWKHHVLLYLKISELFGMPNNNSVSHHILLQHFLGNQVFLLSKDCFPLCRLLRRNSLLWSSLCFWLLKLDLTS